MTSNPRKDRILYQLVSPLHAVVGAAEVERRRALLRRWASPAVEVEISSPPDGPPVVESQIDAAMVFPSLRRLAAAWTPSGHDAVVIGCFSDPGIEALRELTEAAVVGPGEAAMLAAAQFGERFAVLSSDPTPKGLRRRIRAIGLADRFVSEQVVGASVADLRRDPQAAFADILASARGCLAEGADILVLGCLAMCFVEGLVEQLQKALAVPVINPVIAGLKSAEAALPYGVPGAISTAPGGHCRPGQTREDR